MSGWSGICRRTLYAAALHPALEAHALEDPGDDALENLGDDEPDDEDDEGAAMSAGSAPRMAPRPSDSDPITACIVAPCL